jgi:RecA/RadA recombinase
MFEDVKIVGSYPYIVRRRTGLFSLDMALANRGDLGAPMRSIYEVYGYPNSGKSTLCYYMAGKLSPQPAISICDLEMADMGYLKSAVGMSGFKGNVYMVDTTNDKGKIATHEQMMTTMVRDLEDKSGAVILDSIGAIQPIAEAAGDFGEAFVGKRAKLVAQVSRATSQALRLKKEEGCAFVINHTHQIIGGRGHTTAGGETLKYMAAVRIMIWTGEVIQNTDETDVLGFQVSGQVEKLRFGGRGKHFSYYIVPGLGVHPGASAMFDCFDLGLADRGSTVKINGKSLGYLKKDLLEYAMTGKNRKFEPFQELLAEYEATLQYAEDAGDKDTPRTRKGTKSVDEDTEDGDGRE